MRLFLLSKFVTIAVRKITIGSAVYGTYKKSG